MSSRVSRQKRIRKGMCSTFFGLRKDIETGSADPNDTGEDEESSKIEIHHHDMPNPSPNLGDPLSPSQDKGTFKRRAPCESPLPNTPADIQEAYESATGIHREHIQGVIHPPEAPLSEEELKCIFSGAPHFLLEKGHRAQWFPHVVFPWDENTSIQNLRDRRPLQHSSFTLSTLHAHLPVPTEVEGYLGDPENPTELQSIKRPAFDIGVFEVPNMLSSRAKEPGCVGFRHYLELPIAPKIKDESRVLPDLLPTDSLNAPQPKRSNEPYSGCRPGVTFDRLQLIREGPNGWKRLGVRDCSVKNIAERLQTLCDLRDEIILQGKPINLLDRESSSELYQKLFSNFLYPLKERRESTQKNSSLKTQIDVLMRVLAIPGAWIDFSRIEWRIRAGQALWECPPHKDGERLVQTSHDPSIDPGLARKWFLIQLLLTAELVLRLDAAVRVGLMGRSKDLIITQQDIYHMNDTRNNQVDWGIICCRRAFENMSFQYSPKSEASKSVQEQQQQTDRYSRLRSKFAITKPKEKPDSGSPWDCVTIPRFPRRQLEGIFVFAQILQWPDFEHLKYHLKSKLDAITSDPALMAETFSAQLSTDPISDSDKPDKMLSVYENCRTSHLVQLQPPREAPHDRTSTHIGGWVSHTWFSGFVLPGEAVNDLLMATLLENDPEALHVLGPITNLYGGFVYKGRSYWSKMCVIPRVISCLEGSTMCMGWISSPVIPIDEHGNIISDQWLEIEMTGDPQQLTIPRIYQTTKVLYESSPLGGGGGLTPKDFSLPMDDPNLEKLRQFQVRFENISLAFYEDDRKVSSKYLPKKAVAHASFTCTDTSTSTTRKVILPLNNNCYFISSFTCLPPTGYAAHTSTHEDDPDDSSSTGRYHRHFQPRVFDDENVDDVDSGYRRKRSTPRFRLPGHPLHTSFYPYSYLPLSVLPSMTTFPPKLESEHEQHTSSSAYISTLPPGYISRAERVAKNRRRHKNHTYILDARGSVDKETFARAWCVAVCTNAVVSRVGRTCLACSIREAKAADVDVVIRVGSVDSGIV